MCDQGNKNPLGGFQLSRRYRTTVGPSEGLWIGKRINREVVGVRQGPKAVGNDSDAASMTSWPGCVGGNYSTLQAICTCFLSTSALLMSNEAR